MTAQMREMFARGPALLLALLVFFGAVLDSDILIFEAWVFSGLILIAGVKRTPALTLTTISGFGFVIVKIIVL